MADSTTDQTPEDEKPKKGWGDWVKDLAGSFSDTMMSDEPMKPKSLGGLFADIPLAALKIPVTLAKRVVEDPGRAMLAVSAGMFDNPQAARDLETIDTRRANATETLKAQQAIFSYAMEQPGMTPEKALSLAKLSGFPTLLTKALGPTTAKVQKLGKPGEQYIDAQGNVQTVAGVPSFTESTAISFITTHKPDDPGYKEALDFLNIKAERDRATKTDLAAAVAAASAGARFNANPIVKIIDGQLVIIDPRAVRGGGQSLGAPAPAAPPPTAPGTYNRESGEYQGDLGPTGKVPVPPGTLSQAAPATGGAGARAFPIEGFKSKVTDDKWLKGSIGADTAKGIVWHRQDGSVLPLTAVKNREEALAQNAMPFTKDEENRWRIYDEADQHIKRLMQLFPAVKDKIGNKDWPTWVGAKASQYIRSGKFSAFSKGDPASADYYRNMVELNLLMTKKLLPQRIPVYDQQLLMGKNVDPSMRADVQASQLIELNKAIEGVKKNTLGAASQNVKGSPVPSLAQPPPDVIPLD